MSYYFKTTLQTDIASAEAKVREALKAEGFGVLTEIDVKTTLKNKLDVDFRPYKILGACNPPFAHKALLAEEHIGLMLPCNVVLQESSPGEIVVSAIDPLASMQGVNNPDLEIVAGEVRDRLQKIIQSL